MTILVGEGARSDVSNSISPVLRRLEDGNLNKRPFLADFNRKEYVERDESIRIC
jgi:hypothetical protein